MEVFWSEGYEGASLSELTAAMGINSPSLYAAFGSKEALFREAVGLYTSTVGTEIWAAIAEAPTAREAIDRFLHATAEAYTSPGNPHGCLIVLGALHSSGNSAVACEMLRSHRAENLETLRGRLNRAVAEGELPHGLDCLAVASFYTTVQQGMSVQARDGASRETLLGIGRCAMAAWEGLTSSTVND